jgi:hypothetical protein
MNSDMVTQVKSMYVSTFFIAAGYKYAILILFPFKHRANLASNSSVKNTKDPFSIRLPKKKKKTRKRDGVYWIYGRGRVEFSWWNVY